MLMTNVATPIGIFDSTCHNCRLCQPTKFPQYHRNRTFLGCTFPEGETGMRLRASLIFVALAAGYLFVTSWSAAQSSEKNTGGKAANTPQPATAAAGEQKASATC